MKSNQLAAMGGLALVLCLGLGQLAAQENPPPGGDRQGRGGNRGGRGGGGFDPAQMQQRALENLKEQMKVKDDAEWKVLETRIQAVMDTQREIGFGGGMRRLFRRPGGDNNGDQGGGRRGGFGPEPSAEEQALDDAIDKDAAKDVLKSAMAKYRAAKKDKEDKLTTAQEELKKVLTPQQEAVVLAAGLVK